LGANKWEEILSSWLQINTSLFKKSLSTTWIRNYISHLLKSQNKKIFQKKKEIRFMVERVKHYNFRIKCDILVMIVNISAKFILYRFLPLKVWIFLLFFDKFITKFLSIRIFFSISLIILWIFSVQRSEIFYMLTK
jgi:hypothetical protein